jgi:hypothetical protein
MPDAMRNNRNLLSEKEGKTVSEERGSFPFGKPAVSLRAVTKGEKRLESEPKEWLFRAHAIGISTQEPLRLHRLALSGEFLPLLVLSPTTTVLI